MEYDERIELNADGKTGLFKMHLAIAEQVLGLPKPKDNTLKEVFGLTTAELRQELDSPALELTDVRVHVTRGMRHLYVVCRIKDARKLTASKALADRRMSLVRDADGKWSFHQEIVVSERSLTRTEQPGILKQLEARFGSQKVRQMLSKYHLSFSISFPDGFTAESPHGRVHRRRTVIWKRGLDQLAYKRRSWRMEASFVRKS